MKKSLSILMTLAVMATSVAFSGCALMNSTPTQNEVQAITLACSADAILRPTVSALEVFATPLEVQAITAAHTVIDQVCANPSATPTANMMAAFATSTGQITQLVTTLTARKTAAAPTKT